MYTILCCIQLNYSSMTVQLFNLKQIRPYLKRNTTKLLTQTLILSRLQYCNSLLSGFGKLQIDKITI